MKISLFFLSLILLLISCDNDDSEENNNTVKASVISGGPYDFCVENGIPDFTDGLSSMGASGNLFTWVVTDFENNILDLPKTIKDTEKKDFDQAGVGRCKLWLIHFNSEIQNLKKGKNLINDLTESEKTGLSNSILINRTICPE